MSIWADINRRSQGLQKRKEDIPSPEPNLKKPWEGWGEDNGTVIWAYSDNNTMRYTKDLCDIWKSYYSLDDDL